MRFWPDVCGCRKKRNRRLALRKFPEPSIPSRRRFVAAITQPRKNAKPSCGDQPAILWSARRGCRRPASLLAEEAGTVPNCVPPPRECSKRVLAPFTKTASGAQCSASVQLVSRAFGDRRKRWAKVRCRAGVAGRWLSNAHTGRGAARRPARGGGIAGRSPACGVLVILLRAAPARSAGVRHAARSASSAVARLLASSFFPRSHGRHRSRFHAVPAEPC